MESREGTPADLFAEYVYSVHLEVASDFIDAVLATVCGKNIPTYFGRIG